MRKSLILLLMCAAPFVASAHEFWLEPDTFSPQMSSSLVVTVRVGENLDGRRFPFDPRAYKYAFWSGPDGRLDIGRQPVSAQLHGLSAFGEGLHSLVVSSFHQSLTYETENDLRNFLQSIGQEDVLETPAGKNLPTTRITEKYKRSSKLLVHFGSKKGADSRVGMDREWVAIESGFVLFDLMGVAAGHPVEMQCRTDAEIDGIVRQTMFTDENGRLDPDFPRDHQCLLNAVFIGFDAEKSNFTSDWVSLFFRTSEN